MIVLHLNCATAILVVDCYQFDHSSMLRPNMEIMACADLVGGTTEQLCFFPDLIWLYQWYETFPDCVHYTSAVPQPFLLLITANLAQAGWLGWKWGLWPLPAWLVVQRIKDVFYWSYMIVAMILNNSELSASHLRHATAIFVVDNLPILALGGCLGWK